MWKDAQDWESQWHGNCVNSLNEELKQLIYADRMGLVRSPDNKTPYRFDLKGKSVLDIGSGPYSLLLKCENKGFCTAVDPLMNRFPDWVRDRYKYAEITPISAKGEDLNKIDFDFDICLIYNVLQHTEDPQKVIENALSKCSELRIFEWLETPINIGHLHTLTEDKLDEWLGGKGKVEVLDSPSLKGKAYYGIFKARTFKEDRF